MDRILLVEDDRDLAEMFRLLLESEEYKVALAHSLDEATAILSAGSITLILAHVPGVVLDRDTLAMWRAALREVAPQVPVILCAVSPNASRATCVAAGYQGFLEMPFDIEQALGEVKGLLNARVFACDGKGDTQCA